MAPAFHQPLGHWSTLVEGLQASPQECYAAIEAAVQRREIPGVKFSRITHKEAGPLSAERIYLRVEWRLLGFDICAAPFGNGFFFSWWLGELPPSNLLGCLALFLVVGVVGFLVRAITNAREAVGEPMSFLQVAGVGLLLLFVAFWAVGKAVRAGRLFSEDAILSMPFVGGVYHFIFHPDTYYKQDTIAMYRASVQAAVLEVVDEVVSAKGLRALGPEERQPTLRDFLGKGK
jgi:hypothetical protein